MFLRYRTLFIPSAWQIMDVLEWRVPQKYPNIYFFMFNKNISWLRQTVWPIQFTQMIKQS